MPERRMVIDHLTLAVTDLPRSRAFYRAALAPLGFEELTSWTEESKAPSSTRPSRTSGSPVVLRGDDGSGALEIIEGATARLAGLRLEEFVSAGAPARAG